MVESAAKGVRSWGQNGRNLIQMVDDHDVPLAELLFGELALNSSSKAKLDLQDS